MGDLARTWENRPTAADNEYGLPVGMADVIERLLLQPPFPPGLYLYQEGFDLDMLFAFL